MFGHFFRSETTAEPMRIRAALIASTALLLATSCAFIGPRIPPGEPQAEWLWDGGGPVAPVIERVQLRENRKLLFLSDHGGRYSKTISAEDAERLKQTTAELLITLKSSRNEWTDFAVLAVRLGPDHDQVARARADQFPLFHVLDEVCARTFGKRYIPFVPKAGDTD